MKGEHDTFEQIMALGAMGVFAGVVIGLLWIAAGPIAGLVALGLFVAVTGYMEMETRRRNSRKKGTR